MIDNNDDLIKVNQYLLVDLYFMVMNLTLFTLVLMILMLLMDLMFIQVQEEHTYNKHLFLDYKQTLLNIIYIF